MITNMKVADLPAKLRNLSTILSEAGGTVMLPCNPAEYCLGLAAGIEAALARQEEDKTTTPVGQEWTDEQCIEFASCAFRNAPRNPPEGVELTDIRMAASRVMRSAPAAAGVPDESLDDLIVRYGNARYDQGRCVTHSQHEELRQASAELYAEISARLAAPPAAQAVDLPDDLSESKDWRESDYNGRIDWLKAMHASQRAQIVRLQNDMEILRALVDQQGRGCGMIQTYDKEGRDVLLNPSEISSVEQAGVSDQWHGTKSYIRLSNGRLISCGESVMAIAQKIDQQAGKGVDRA
jgi:hypothetical protein